MGSAKPRLTAVERARRKKIKALIRDGRVLAKHHRVTYMIRAAGVLDDLADVAEEYLKGLK